MSLRAQIILTLSALAAAFALFELTNLDLFVQDYFYDFASPSPDRYARWAVNKYDPLTSTLVHSGVKYLIVAAGVAAALALAASFIPLGRRFEPYRRNLLFFVLSLALASGTLSGLKQVTNVYCPSQIERYGGPYPYVKLLDRYPTDFAQDKKGKCFPAGHPSGGFALMALFFLFSAPWKRGAGLAFGLSLGWGMGLFQMLRGEHYLSHVVATMLGAWLIILLLRGVFLAALKCADGRSED